MSPRHDENIARRATSRITSTKHQLVPAAGDGSVMRFFADRARVYPKAVSGPIRRFKWAILTFCLTLYYVLPWIRWDRGMGVPDQAVLLDIASRRFYFFTLEIWPQEFFYLTGLLITAAVGLFLVTSVVGRVWCGFACPQTVWTDLFMWVERVIEGDRGERMRRDALPNRFNTATLDKIGRKLAKHGIWLFVALATGGAWIMYFIDAPTVVTRFFTGTADTATYSLIFLFTSTTYLLAGWAREQVCTYMCPWPRFQAAMFDDQTITVTYQAWRGEPRAPHKAGEAWDNRGDCIDCGQCIAACPTGIDIREGVQLECIGCGLCIDSCNSIMQKIDRPKNLIWFDSLANTEARAQGATRQLRLIRPRTLIYLGLLTIVSAVMLMSFSQRERVGLSVLRDRAPLYVLLSDGSISNGYQIKVLNKSREAYDFTLTGSGLPHARLLLAEGSGAPTDRAILSVPGDTIATFRVLVHAPQSDLETSTSPFVFTLLNPVTGEQTITRSAFIGPQMEAAP